MVYDELMRRRLADRSQKNTPGFNPEVGTHLLDDHLLKQAEKTFAERGAGMQMNNQNHSQNHSQSYSPNHQNQPWKSSKGNG